MDGTLLTMLFQRQSNLGSGIHILLATHRDTLGSAWQSPAQQQPYNLHGFVPSVLSMDGVTLCVGAVPGSNGWDMHYSTWNGSTWTAPVIATALNSAYNDSGGVITSDGNTVYFASYRRTTTDYDLWVARRDTPTSAWHAPVQDHLGLVNTSGMESQPWVSADELTLYFVSDRAGGFGLSDIYVATRATVNEDWDDVTNLGAAINSSGEEATPWVSPDGRTLFWGSDRAGGWGSYDIWMSSR